MWAEICTLANQFDKFFKILCVTPVLSQEAHNIYKKKTQSKLFKQFSFLDLLVVEHISPPQLVLLLHDIIVNLTYCF